MVGETAKEKPAWTSMLDTRELIHFILKKLLPPSLIHKTSSCIL